jgi:preprotein translocase subunit YajC
MGDILNLWILAVVVVLLLALLLSILLWVRRQRAERERRWRQLNSVYNHRDRRQRGN